MKRLWMIALMLSAAPAWGQVIQFQNYGAFPVPKAAAAGAFTCVETETGQLLAYWKMDENTGTTAVDTSTGGHDGTFTNTPTWGTGTCGSGITFVAASSQYLALALDASGIIGDGVAFTISAWIKGTSSANQTIYAEGNTGNTAQFIYVKLNENVAGDCEFGIQGDVGVGGGFISTGNIGLNDGNWHHIVAIQTSKSARELYVDNVSRGTNTNILVTLTLNTANIGTFERTTKAAYMDGTIDQVRVYNVGITATQVGNIFDSGK